MHHEDMCLRIEKVQQTIKKTQEVVKKWIEQNNILIDKGNTSIVDINKLQQRVVEIQWDVDELTKNKLDIKMSENQTGSIKRDLFSLIT